MHNFQGKTPLYKTYEILTYKYIDMFFEILDEQIFEQNLHIPKL